MANANLTDREREQMRQWLATWRRAGPLLDQERAQRVGALTDTDAARMALDLWGFAQPRRGDDGEGLLPMAHALQKLGNR